MKKKNNWKDFWKKFDDIFASMDELIDEEDDSINTIGNNNRIFNKSYSSSTTTNIINGDKVVVKTVNGKTTVTINGKKYVPEK